MNGAAVVGSVGVNIVRVEIATSQEEADPGQDLRATNRQEAVVEFAKPLPGQSRLDQMR